MFDTFSTKRSIRVWSILAVLVLVVQTSVPLFAISIPSASSMASDLEKRYNINTDAIRDQGQQFNVMNQKKNTPEVSIHFTPSDPKVGEKLTAVAFPTWYSTPEEQLYYTWYLKRVGCDLKNAGLTATEQSRCDLDRDGKITVEDWKTEAMRTIASNEFDAPVDYAASGLSDNDNDGYKARYGGGNMVGVYDHCYYQDQASGQFYELADGGDVTFTYTSGGSNVACESGQTPVCIKTDTSITPGTIDASATGGDGGSGGGSGTGGSGGTGGDSSVSGDTFVEGAGNSAIAGYPVCSGGSPSCYVGTPCCVNNPTTASSCEQSLTSCDASSLSDAGPYCKHLFPNMPGNPGSTGNGNFGLSEENFWFTNPNDPSTANNGNKDEANVAGLGQSRFKWNYATGDLLGVVVEGTSLIPTKHSDSSSMIMWAFSRNNCPMSVASGTGAYQKGVKGYNITFPTVDIDLNDCLERNLVDPTQGGQATNLEIDLKATPELPQNDGTGRNDGDVLDVSAAVTNAARTLTDTFFDWRIDLSPNGTPNPTNWVNVTAELNSLPDNRKLLSAVRGSGVNTVRLKLNILDSDVLGTDPVTGNKKTFAQYLSGGTGYFRFRLDASENFDATGVTRKGRSSVIVKFTSSGERIHAYIVNVTGDPARVSLSPAEICTGSVNPTDSIDQQALDKLESKVCRVLKNEIIGVEIDNPGNAYSNFSWTMNGKPLVCNSKVSASCFDDRQASVAFFPVIGELDDTVTISVSANKVDARTSTDESISLSRLFRIVNPTVEIVPGNSNVEFKQLGTYRDANGDLFPDYSKDTLWTLPDSDVALKARFIPGFLGTNLAVPTAARWPKVELSWKVDETELGGGATTSINFLTEKPAGSIYNVVLSAVYRPTETIRKALSDIWGISVFDAGEQYFGASVQLEHPPTELLPKKDGPTRYLALLSSYLPASVLFGLRVLLMIAFILFVAGLVMAWLPTIEKTSTFTRGQRFTR